MLWILFYEIFITLYLLGVVLMLVIAIKTMKDIDNLGMFHIFILMVGILLSWLGLMLSFYIAMKVSKNKK